MTLGRVDNRNLSPLKYETMGLSIFFMKEPCRAPSMPNGQHFKGTESLLNWLRKHPICLQVLTIALSLGKVLMWLFWSLLAVLLAATWINSIVHANHDAVRYVELEATVLVLLGLLSGFEIAFADLRDKDPSQVRDDIRDMLRDMQGHGEEIYQAREWLSVPLVVAAALLAEFDWDFPAFLRVALHSLQSDHPWLHLSGGHKKLLLSLLFTTLPVVWFAQAPAKFLSYLNSERFLSKFRGIWFLIRWTIHAMHFLQINSVSSLLLLPFRGVWEKEKRNLPPSDSALYVNLLKRYGYGIHNITETITIEQDGSATITLLATFHIIGGERTGFRINQSYASNCLSCEAELVSAFFCPIPGEKIADVENQIAASLLPALPSGFELIPSDYFDVKGTINGKSAPINIFCAQPLGTDSPPRGAIFRVKAESRWEKNAFESTPGKEDSFWLECQFPYQELRAILRFANNADLGFSNPSGKVSFQGNEHKPEEKRITARPILGSSAGIETVISYPLPGATYTLTWKVWKR